MDLLKLRVFDAVAVEGSMTAAARRLLLSQPSVSIHVRDLEHSVGVPLFVRLGRGVRLTDAGEVLAGYARRILALESDARDALAAFRDASTGSISIGASSTPGVYVLPHLLAAFREAHPHVAVDLHILDTGAVGAWLADLSVDLGITGGPIEGMDNRRWMRDELFLVGPPGHSGTGRRRPATALASVPMVMREQGSSVRADAEAWLAARGIDAPIAMTLQGSEAVKRAVAAGLGVTIASRHAVAEEVSRGVLEILPVTGLPIRRWLYLVCNPRKPLLPAARRLMTALEGHRDTSAVGGAKS